MILKVLLLKLEKEVCCKVNVTIIAKAPKESKFNDEYFSKLKSCMKRYGLSLPIEA